MIHNFIDHGTPHKECGYDATHSIDIPNSQNLQQIYDSIYISTFLMRCTMVNKIVNHYKKSIIIIDICN